MCDAVPHMHLYVHTQVHAFLHNANAKNGIHTCDHINILHINPPLYVSQSAIMATADCITTFQDAILPFLLTPKADTGLLMQLLLKASSNDKRFVVEEARATLDKLAIATALGALLRTLEPLVEHRSPKVNGSGWVVWGWLDEMALFLHSMYTMFTIHIHYIFTVDIRYIYALPVMIMNVCLRPCIFHAPTCFPIHHTGPGSGGFDAAAGNGPCRG